MDAVKVILYPSAMDMMLKSPVGEVGRYLAGRARLIVVGARGQVGKKTGKLQASIHSRQSRTAYGQMVWIGSTVEYALAHHEGTKPHIIRPDKAKALRFTSGSRIIYSRAVKHPGTRANRYLKDQLYIAVL
jgi:hypothetical protein